MLRRIDKTRRAMVLALSLIERVDEAFPDEPMGLDSKNRSNAVFVSGVFSRIAMISMMRVFSYGLPDHFTVIDLPEIGSPDGDAKLHFPRAGFATCTDAVWYMVRNAPQLALLHDAVVERQLNQGGYR